MAEEGKAKLIFVVGNSRSGTTMMGRILGNHPEIFTFHELHFFEQLVSAGRLQNTLTTAEARHLFAMLLSIQRIGLFAERKPEQFEREAASALPGSGDTPFSVYHKFLNYETVLNHKQIPCEQTPRNIFYLKEIISSDPGVRVIFMLRDVRDVLLSQKQKWKRRYLGAKHIPLKESVRAWSNYHPITISKLWNSSYASARHFFDHPQVYRIRFEDLVSNPSDSIRNICSFLDVSYSDRLLEVPNIGSSLLGDDPVKKGINKDRSGSWQKGGLTTGEIFYCDRITKKIRHENNYPDSGISANPFLVLWYGITFPLKLILAFALNIHRMRNIADTLKRRLKS